jgi:hypothetical protein
MRSIFLAEVGSLFLFWIAFSFIAPWDGGNEGWVPWGVVAAGCLAIIGITLVRSKPVRGVTPTSIANAYRSQWFISFGFAMSPALFGLCGVLIRGSLWIYVPGLMFTLAGLAWIAPTRRDIERRQGELDAAGIQISLLNALMTTPVPKSRRWFREPPLL